MGGPPGAYMGAAAGLAASQARRKLTPSEEVAQVMAQGGVSREVAECVLRIQNYMDLHGVTWEEAEKIIGGGKFNVGKTREIKELSEGERAFIKEQEALPAAASSSAPSAADWRHTSMTGLTLASSGIKETEALAYAHELYKNPELRGYMDETIGSRIPSMKDIQELYEALEDTPMREYLLSVQDRIVKRHGEDYMLIEGAAPVVAVEPRFTRLGAPSAARGASGSSGGVFHPRVTG